MMQNGNVADELDALIVGSGFGGVWLLYNLRKKLGFKAKIYEAAQSLGGVWEHNRYPGLDCDASLLSINVSDSSRCES